MTFFIILKQSNKHKNPDLKGAAILSKLSFEAPIYFLLIIWEGDL
jgi:hypothetical protein